MAKRILHVIPSLIRGGAQRLVVSICNNLEKNPKYDVKLIIFRNINKFKEDTKNINIEHVKINYKTSFLFKFNSYNIQKLNNSIENFNPDILHTHLFEADIICRINPYNNIKYFSHFHDHTYKLNQFLINPFRKKNLTKIHDILFLEKLFVKSENTFICISKEFFNFYSKKSRRLKLKIHKLYNCVDYNKFKGVKRQISNKEIKLINCARNIEIKNQQFLIDVMNNIVHENKISNVKLTILGDGELHDFLKNKTRSLNLESYISFPGMVKDVEKYYKESDIYLHSGLDGIFGISTLEALASGLPIIGIRGLIDDGIIRNEINALVYEKNNLNLFVEGIFKLINDKLLYKKISKNNLTTGERFSEKNYTKELIKIYFN